MLAINWRLIGDWLAIVRINYWRFLGWDFFVQTKKIRCLCGFTTMFCWRFLGISYWRIIGEISLSRLKKIRCLCGFPTMFCWRSLGISYWRFVGDFFDRSLSIFYRHKKRMRTIQVRHPLKNYFLSSTTFSVASISSRDCSFSACKL